MKNVDIIVKENGSKQMFYFRVSDLAKQRSLVWGKDRNFILTVKEGMGKNGTDGTGCKSGEMVSGFFPQAQFTTNTLHTLIKTPKHKEHALAL